MIARFPTGAARREQGNTLLVALSTIATLAAVAGAFISTITSRSQTVHQSASWQAASLAAESAADLAVAEIRRVLTEVGTPPADRWQGWESSSTIVPTGMIPAGVRLQRMLPPLLQAGDGRTTSTASVTIDAPTGMTLSGRQWLRVRSEGTAFVSGQPALSKLDARLRRISFVRDWRTGQAVDRPRVTRSIEVIVQPVLPFRSAILTQGRIDVGNSQTIADSFDSSDPQKSTSGEYDSARRQNNGSVFTNEADFTFGGTIYGAAGTNGGTLASSPRITGPVTNSSLKPLPPIPAPNWTSIAPGPTTITAPTTIAAVTSSAPTRYKFSAIGGDLTISGAAGSTVEVWVTGDISGKVIVEPGVRASIYVGGNIRLSSSTLENRNRRAADLQIYGIDPPAGETRAMDFDISREIHAAVYAPAHVIQLTGNGHFTGSITGRSLKTSGRAQFHYDEMLSLRTGPVLSYTVASWIEDVR